MRLGIDKIKTFGWKPEITSEESVRRAIRATLAE